MERQKPLKRTGMPTISMKKRIKIRMKAQTLWPISRLNERTKMSPDLFLPSTGSMYLSFSKMMIITTFHLEGLKMSIKKYL